MNQMKLFSISLLKFNLNEFVWFDVNLCVDARQLSLVVPTKTMYWLIWLTQVTKDMRETTFGCHWTAVKAVRSHCCPQSAVDLVSHGKPVFAVLVTRFLPTHLLHVALWAQKKMKRNETSQKPCAPWTSRGLVNGFNFFVIAWMESLHPRKRWRSCRLESNKRQHMVEFGDAISVVMSNKNQCVNCNTYCWQASDINLGVW